MITSQEQILSYILSTTTQNPRLDPYAARISSILQINKPEIRFAPFVLHIVEQPGQSIFIEDEFLARLLVQTGKCNPGTGVFVEAVNTIVVAEYGIEVSSATGEMMITALADADCVATIAHEMMHMWQATYHPEKYRQLREAGLWYVIDPLEIDADAFAIAFCLQATDLTCEDLAFSIRELKRMEDYDNMARWDRAEEYALKYGFDSVNNIKKARNSC